MHQTLTPHYVQELRRVRRKKSLAQLRWVALGVTAIVGIPIALLAIIGLFTL